jgi:C1A family cysteine protease
MKHCRTLPMIAAVLFLVGTPVAVSAAGQGITPPGTYDFQYRELKAPPKISMKLMILRNRIAAQKLTYEVGYTAAMDFELEKLVGLSVPANFEQEIQSRNLLAARRLKELPAVTAPKCSKTAPSFDWRKIGDVSPVKDQGACGSSWNFATIGSFEGSWRAINNEAIRTSAQDVLDCSNEGSCGRGWWAFEYLIHKGVTAEETYPYHYTRGACNNSAARPYKADTWGYVGTNHAIPNVAAMKDALCAYGPLAVAVQVTDAFAAYTGGVFNEKATGKVNHGVTLLGWDDSKNAWLIKNSWGTGWGSTCDYGTERGYMWISYNSNSIGYAAAWVRAKAKPKSMTENCVPFNHTTTTVKKVNNSWKIVDGDHSMFNFGKNQAAANRSLKVIKFYKMNSSCSVGRPDPVFNYFLVGNSAPGGNMSGQDCIKFNPNAIQIKEIDSQWKIFHGNKVMYDFENKIDEAYHTFHMIKKYGFTYQCYVKGPKPPFHYLHK